VARAGEFPSSTAGTAPGGEAGKGAGRTGRLAGAPALWRFCALQIILAAVLFLAGETLLALFPVQLRVSAPAPGASAGGSGATAAIALDGQTYAISLAAPLQSVEFPPLTPNQREYQVDGSDTTNNFTLDAAAIAQQATSPYFRLQSLLRDEATYSLWYGLAVRDGAGRDLASGLAPGAGKIPLPAVFSLDVSLHRLETPRSVVFLDGAGNRLTLEINRNDKNVRLTLTRPGGASEELSRTYFASDWRPPLAEVLYAFCRAASLALLLSVLFLGLVSLMPVRTPALPAWWPRLALGACLALVLGAGCYTSVVLFAKLPHIFDSIAYYFQAKILASGALAGLAPSLREAFPTPFMVFHDGHWFAQYPPGAPLVFAAGLLVGLPWLIGPLLATGAVFATYQAGRRQYGPRTALLAAALLASSPFLALQAGSYFSHVPALCFAACFLYAATRFQEKPSRAWGAAAGLALGATFLTRETVAVLYGLSVGLYALAGAWRRDRQRVVDGALAAAVGFLIFLAAYLLYNQALTGSRFTSPRQLFGPTDTIGFGEGIGFYGQHTLAAGLVNADELLTSLNIYLFGWPFYLTLALPALPFLLGRARAWDRVHGAVFVLFVLAYVAYFYHGIALGPRYYLEALPSLGLLTARGFASLAEAAGAVWRDAGRRLDPGRPRLAAMVVCGLLLLPNATFFVPNLNRLYDRFQGTPGGRGPAWGDFVRPDVAGYTSTLGRALVTTDDWWVYTAYLAPLNCPNLDCATVYAFQAGDKPADPLRSAYPGRDWYKVVKRNGVLVAERQ
jgi:hypothetical protein